MKKNIESWTNRVQNDVLQQSIARFKNQLTQAVSDSEDITPDTITNQWFNEFQKDYRKNDVERAKAAPHILECFKIIAQASSKEEALQRIRDYLIKNVSIFEREIRPTLIGLCNLLVINSKEWNEQEYNDLQIIWKEIRNYLKESWGFLVSI